jgi:transcriptional regulator with XRE-family HTH domain
MSTEPQRIKLDAVTDLPFGARLKRLREAAGLTQEELAVRVGLSRNAVGALERGLHKRPYPYTIRSLADALELSENERTALLVAVPEQGSVDAPVAPALAMKSNLSSPSTSLLSRERELGEIRAFLQKVRLLTLAGTGGVGKTRLAVQAARDAAGLFPDSTVFVSLAALGDSGIVVPTVAQSLSLREAEDHTPREALRAYLREKRLLLVLDNFEHVLETAP